MDMHRRWWGLWPRWHWSQLDQWTNDLKVTHSSSDLIKERNGGSAGTMMHEGYKGEDGGPGVPHQLLEASRKRLSSFETSRWILPFTEAKNSGEERREADPAGAVLGILHFVHISVTRIISSLPFSLFASLFLC